MPSNTRRDRDRRPGRQEAFRDPRPIILIVCEGLNTEPQYFKQYINYCRNPLVQIKIAPERGVPLTLVKIAKEYKRSSVQSARRERDDNLVYDAVWCVFDVDDHPNLANAKVMARDNGIELAISNPCFELWLLLHLRECPGAKHRHEIQLMLRQYINDYGKNVCFDLFAGGYEQAVLRAIRLDSLAEECGTPGHNPTTGVYRLTERIKGNGT